MKKHTFTIIITQDEDGMYVAECPAIPGCHTQGATYEEAEKNIAEAIHVCLQAAADDREYKKSIDFSQSNTPRMISIGTISVPLALV